MNGANYSNEAVKSVSGCVVEQMELVRGEAERLKTQPNIENWVSIAVTTMDYHC